VHQRICCTRDEAGRSTANNLPVLLRASRAVPNPTSCDRDYFHPCLLDCGLLR
jgi:hypothetical protein